MAVGISEKIVFVGSLDFSHIHHLRLRTGPLRGVVVYATSSIDGTREWPEVLECESHILVPVNSDKTELFTERDASTPHFSTKRRKYAYVRFPEKETTEPCYEYVPDDKLDEVLFERRLLRIGRVLE